MSITGREKITVISKAFGSDDEYGNPVETITERVIKNVLVGQTGSTIIYGLHDTASQDDLTVYMSAKEKIRPSDEFVYEGRSYHQTSLPTLWKTSAGSIVKPKLIVNLKAVD